MNSAPVLTYLEMVSHDQLRVSPDMGRVRLEPLTHGRPLIRQLTLRVGADFAWPSLSWSASRWSEYLDDRTLRHWCAVIDSEPIGIASVSEKSLPDMEIDSFGLVPEYHCQGLGGPFLSQLVTHLFAEGASRVWLHTSSFDHPNALANYLNRGFQRFSPSEFCRIDDLAPGTPLSPAATGAVPARRAPSVASPPGRR